MSSESHRDVVELIRATRWAALATALQGGRPSASMVAYAVQPDMSLFLLHLSRLAPHTRNLLADPRASLAVSEQDSGDGDPQTLARATLHGRVEIIAMDDANYAAYRELYVARLPESRRLFDFPDFLLFRFVPDEIRYVGGFAMARTYSPAQLRALAEAE